MIFAPSVRVAKRQPIIERKTSVEVRPLLRPLSLAQQCKYLGPLIDRTKCGTEVWLCKKHGTCSQQPHRCGEMKLCQNCESWERTLLHEHHPVGEQSLRVPVRFDEKNLAPNTGGQRLNPSILKTNEGYLFAYRNSWGNANVSIIRLTKDFLPINQPVQLNLHYKGATDAGREDPRLFWHKGKPHIWYIGWNGRRSKNWNKANVLFARINEKTLQVEDKFFPKIPGRNSWEKNHSYFDLNDETYCVYSIVPHKVHKVFCEEVEQTWETPTADNWRYGYLRGGASPVLHRGAFYHFFHGMIEPNGIRLYTLGCAVFEAQPPFKITRITHEPIEVAGTNPIKENAKVIFPGGAVFVDGRWCVAMGVHDAWSELRFYSDTQIESALISV